MYFARFGIVSIVLLLMLPLLSPRVSAMPIFARKYDLKCSYCHTTIPRLNETGFRFRAAGFRLPTEIGKEDSSAFNIGDYTAIDVVGAVSNASSTPPGAAAKSNFAMGLDEVGIHPITGALTKDFSSDVMLTYSPVDGFGVEMAYGQYTTGNQDGFFSAKLGILHPFQGYGASDEPMGLSRPLFQENPSTGPTGSTFFTPWGFNQFGAELGYSLSQTAIRASVLGGTFNTTDGFKPVQGTDPKPDGPSANSVDLQLFATQFLTESGAALSGYFYLGKADLPTGIATPDSALFQNKFMRYAVYGTLPIAEATLMAGFQQGKDNSWIDSTWSNGSDFTSQGWFAEADYRIAPLVGVGLRYDQFQPRTAVTDNALTSVAAFVNYGFGNGLQIVAEYRALRTQMGPGQKQADDTFGINFIWIH